MADRISSLSRGAPSTTRPPLHTALSKDFNGFGNDQDCSFMQKIAERCENMQGDAGDSRGTRPVPVLLSDQKTVTLVDAADLHLLEGHRWHPRLHGKRIYVRAKFGRDWVYLHRWIMQPPKGLVIDHIDRDPLNNTRANMRVVSHGTNIWNAESCLTGHSRKNGKWRARIRCGKTRLELGFYETEMEAMAAYNTAVCILRDPLAARPADAGFIPLSRFPPTARRFLESAA